LFEAFSPIVVMLLLLAGGYGVLELDPEPLLILASVYAGIVALRLGYSWDEMMEGVQEKIKQAMTANLIFIYIGNVIDPWIVAGTIPMMIYYGIQLINPICIVLVMFVVSAIISIVTGTSWGSIGTVGVALMGIATGLGRN